jgi:DUF4097 and DUF4098 domain-containing protein YvlB
MHTTKRKTWPLLVILIGVVLNMVGCNVARIGELNVETRSIDLQEADAVRVEIETSSGNLTMSGGADSTLLDAEFTDNVPEWRPNVRYTVNGREGKLIVKRPDTHFYFVTDDVRYEWDLAFTKKVPLDLCVETGSADARLDLSGMSLTRLGIHTSSGEFQIDGAGEQRALRTIEVDTMSGDITLELTGDCGSLVRVDAQTSTGDLTFDLTGRWAHDLDVTIDSAAGHVNLLLPRDAGVSVTVDTSAGGVTATGLSADGKTYVNNALGSAPVTLNISVKTSSGNVILELAE